MLRVRVTIEHEFEVPTLHAAQMAMAMHLQANSFAQLGHILSWSGEGEGRRSIHIQGNGCEPVRRESVREVDEPKRIKKVLDKIRTNVHAPGMSDLDIST